MDTGYLRYVTTALGTVLLIVGAHLKVDTPEYWIGTAFIYGIAIADQIKHRND